MHSFNHFVFRNRCWMMLQMTRQNDINKLMVRQCAQLFSLYCQYIMFTIICSYIYLKHIKCIKYIKIHKPLPVSGFHRPIIRSYQNM
jgi:hypothetical protein